MKRTSLIYLLTFSLALNGAAAATLAFSWWTSQSQATEMSLAQKPVKKFLREDLSLTREQTKPILEQINRSKPEFVKLSHQIDAKRSEIIHLISSVPVNVNGVKTKVGEITRIQSELRLVAVGALMKIAESLPPEARPKFAAYLEEQARSHGGCPARGVLGDR